jgi:hypothetical protein
VEFLLWAMESFGTYAEGLCLLETFKDVEDTLGNSFHSLEDGQPVSKILHKTGVRTPLSNQIKCFLHMRSQ